MIRERIGIAGSARHLTGGTKPNLSCHPLLGPHALGGSGSRAKMIIIAIAAVVDLAFHISLIVALFSMMAYCAIRIFDDIFAH
jgi:hypothetical protein